MRSAGGSLRGRAEPDGVLDQLGGVVELQTCAPTLMALPLFKARCTFKTVCILSVPSADAELLWLQGASRSKESLIMQNWQHRLLFIAAIIVAGGASFSGRPLEAQEPSTNAQPLIPAVCPDHRGVVAGPTLSVAEGAPRLPGAQPDAADRPLPINLATALRLAGARPVIIAAAQASVQVAEAELARAKVLWLPSFNVGAGYYRHDGVTQGQSGNIYKNTKDDFFAGAGL